MNDYLTNYRKTKVNYFKNTTKNFYRKEFQRDKQLTNLRKSVKNTKEIPSLDNHIKNYRIKTSLGLRPFEKDKPNATFSQTSYSKFHRPHDETTEDATNLQFETSYGSPEKTSCASKIDGMGLLVNPFEAKPKRKKR